MTFNNAVYGRVLCFLTLCALRIVWGGDADTQLKSLVVSNRWGKDLTRASAFPVPDAPTGVSASDGTYLDKVVVTWTASLGATNYCVYRGVFNGLSAARRMCDTSETNYTDSAMGPGTCGYYWVTASNSAGTSEFSALDSGYRALASPIGVHATDTSTDAVRVTWKTVVNASYYRVYRATSSAGEKTALGNWQTSRRYRDTSAVAGTIYHYWVVAAGDRSGDRPSAYSDCDTGLRLVSVALDTAFDATGLSWTTGGDATWFGQTNVTCNGVNVAMSGNVNDGQSTWLQATVTGPGTLSFWWKASSEFGYDYLQFGMDGTNLWSLSGTTAWAQRVVRVGARSHALVWTYLKDGSKSLDWDCGWVGRVVWTPEITDHDLVFYAPSAWPNGFFLSHSATGLTSCTTFMLNDAIYLSYALMDARQNDIVNDFTNRVSIVRSGNTCLLASPVDGGLPGGYYNCLQGYSWSALQGLTSGTYTVTGVLNCGNTIVEGDYSNNVRSITFTINGAVPASPEGVSASDGTSTNRVTVP